MRWRPRRLWPAADPQPFAGIRWVRLLLIFGGMAGMVLSPCSGENEAAGVRMWALNIGGWMLAAVGCLWEAHARILMAGSFRWSAWLGRSAHNAASVLGGWMLLIVPVGMLLPAYGCYGNRVKVVGVMSMAIDLKNTINERVAKTHTLSDVGKGLSVEPGSYNTKGYVSSDGTIVLFVGDAQTMVMMSPALVEGDDSTVKWTCMGWPHKNVPAECRR